MKWSSLPVTSSRAAWMVQNAKGKVWSAQRRTQRTPQSHQGQILAWSGHSCLSSWLGSPEVPRDLRQCLELAQIPLGSQRPANWSPKAQGRAGPSLCWTDQVHPALLPAVSALSPASCGHCFPPRLSLCPSLAGKDAQSRWGQGSSRAWASGLLVFSSHTWLNPVLRSPSVSSEHRTQSNITVPRQLPGQQRPVSPAGPSALTAAPSSAPSLGFTQQAHMPGLCQSLSALATAPCACERPRGRRTSPRECRSRFSGMS